MNAELILLIGVIPMTILVVSAFVKYPFGEKGDARKGALKDFFGDLGLSFFFMGFSMLISTTIAWHEENVSNAEMFLILIFGLCSMAVAHAYTLERTGKLEGKVSLCLLTGLVLGLIPVAYALYVILVIM